MAVKENYKNYTWTGKKKYRLTNNADGTVSLEDVTPYVQVGDNLNASDLNAIGTEVNDVSANVSMINSVLTSAIIRKRQNISISISSASTKSVYFDVDSVSGYTAVGISGYSFSTSNWILETARIASTGLTGDLFVQSRDGANKTATITLSLYIMYVKNELVGGLE